MRFFLLVSAAMISAYQPFTAAAAQLPGPSAQLFAQHYYTCTKNYYVSQSGSDSNSGLSTSAAWLTLQHANNTLPATGAAGTCINVAPGAYRGVEITHGGNLASATGYVVYRCTTMDACTVNGNAGIHGAEAFETLANTQGTPPNYLIIDGFTMSGGNSSANGVAISSWNGNNGSAVATHHLWVINSIISGFGQSGIGAADAEYYYFIHNRVYGNSNLQCSFQGSGIAINTMHSVPNYKPTADDMKNPDAAIGPAWVVGSSFFHNVVEWNIVYNNALTHCGTPSNPTDTDGNGIIFDTNLTSGGDTQNYLSPSLTAFNVVYNNGGAGIHLFRTAYVTVANNTCYNNELDPGNGGTARPCIDDSDGYADTFINNIAVAVPAASGGKCIPASAPFQKYNIAIIGYPIQAPYDTFKNNITQLVGSSCVSEALVGNGDTYSCTLNKCATNPGWVSVGTSSVGTDRTQPVNANFALQAGSPAIGKGVTEPYLWSQSVDVGACASAYTQCK
jgi:parallel beta-helix repeat protein